MNTLNRAGVVGSLALGLALLTADGSVLSAQSGQAKEGDKTAAPMNATAGDIAANPTKYYGKKVVVRAEVEDVLGAQIFLLDEDRLYAWPDVLVITPALATPVQEDTMVTVTGAVRAYVETEFRRDYDWNWWDRMDPDIEMTFRNRPAIVADSVKTSAGAELIRR